MSRHATAMGRGPQAPAADIRSGTKAMRMRGRPATVLCSGSLIEVVMQLKQAQSNACAKALPLSSLSLSSQFRQADESRKVALPWWAPHLRPHGPSPIIGIDEAILLYFCSAIISHGPHILPQWVFQHGFLSGLTRRMGCALDGRQRHHHMGQNARGTRCRRHAQASAELASAA